MDLKREEIQTAKNIIKMVDALVASGVRFRLEPLRSPGRILLQDEEVMRLFRFVESSVEAAEVELGRELIQARAELAIVKADPWARIEQPQ